MEDIEKEIRVMGERGHGEVWTGTGKIGYRGNMVEEVWVRCEANGARTSVRSG
jgi:hypothetical protein